MGILVDRDPQVEAVAAALRDHRMVARDQLYRIMGRPLPEAFSFVEAVCRALQDLGVCGIRDMTNGLACCLDEGTNIFAIPSEAQWLKAADTTRPFPELFADLPDELIRM